MDGEQVLVFPVKELEKEGIFQNVLSGGRLEKYLTSLLGSAFYMDRDKAEIDPTYKQVVVYAVIRQWNKLFHYRRNKSGGESRLYSHWSIGVGGHVNPVDGPAGMETVEKAVIRELSEEVEITGRYTTKAIGLVNDDSTEVGKVHLGVIYEIKLEDGARVAIKDSSIEQGEFEFVPYLRRRSAEFETWSRFILGSNLFR